MCDVIDVGVFKIVLEEDGLCVFKNLLEFMVFGYGKCLYYEIKFLY